MDNSCRISKDFKFPFKHLFFNSRLNFPLKKLQKSLLKRLLSKNLKAFKFLKWITLCKDFKFCPKFTFQENCKN
ncbi:hypothetical protein AA995_07315 [Campylobacter vulpis]|nr:hypothetical protein AA995_07315 [Campylobacter vulpis]